MPPVQVAARARRRRQLGLDRLNQVRDWLTPRRNVLGNRDRLNRLVLLMQLQLNDLADEARYAAHIRDWLHARDGHAAERRLLATPPATRRCAADAGRGPTASTQPARGGGSMAAASVTMTQ